MAEGETIAEQIARLRGEVERHDMLYYARAEPEISDREYDRLKAELVQLETTNPEFASETTPTLRVGDDRVAGFQTRAHREPMLSLDNTYNKQDLFAFDQRLCRLFKCTTVDYVVEPKIDGLAMSLTFERGRFTRAVTRGNGVEGDDVTNNIKTIQTLPQELSGAPFPEFIEIRGEVYMHNEEFLRINREREEAGLPLFRNPRNLTAGTVKLLDPAQVARRRLEIVLYGVGHIEGDWVETQSAAHDRIRAWGLPTLEQFWRCHGIDAVWNAITELDAIRAQFAYGTDGAVVKVDNLALRREAGFTSKAPRGAIAYKFESERVETLLREIRIQVGRSGALTPVAELEPVLLGGTMVSRATLHNEDEIRRKDIREGDTVIVEKAGEVIPAVVGVVSDNRTTESQPFDFGTRLRELGFDAARAPGQAVWRLIDLDAPARRCRAIMHFAGRTAMDIEGLGTAVADQLVFRGLARDVADLYDLTFDQAVALDGFAEKSAQKLLGAIAKSKQNPLWRLLHGLGIPHVGAQAAKDLARAMPSLSMLLEADPESLRAIHGIGDVMADAICAFFQDASNRDLIQRLRNHGIDPVETSTPIAAGPLAGKSFVITGALPDLSREDAKALIEANGGKVISSVSSKTDFVLAGESPGSKLQRAIELKIPVIDRAQLSALLEER